MFAQGAFNRPGILHSGGELRYLSEKYHEDLKNGDLSPYWLAFEQTVDKAVTKAVSQREGERLTTFRKFDCMQPTHIKGNGHLPGEPCSEFPKDGFHAYILALKWAVSRDSYYGDLSRKILLAWANEFTGLADDEFGVGGTAIQSSKSTSWAAAQFANAAEILKTYKQSPTVWRQSDTPVVETFLLELRKVITRTKEENAIANDIQAMIEARLAIAVFLDDRDSFNYVIALWEDRVRKTIYLRSDGAEPYGTAMVNGRTKEAHWGNPLGYGQSELSRRMPDGFQIETCRDLNHVDIGFRSMIYAAQTALNQGVDLYDHESERLAAFINYHSQLELGTVAQPQVCDNIASEFRVQCKPQLRAGVAPDCPIDTWYLAYQNLTERLDVSIENTHQLLIQEEYSNIYVDPPVNGYKWLVKWEGFTHAHNLYDAEHDLWRRCDVENGKLYSFKNAKSGRYLFAEYGNLIEYGGQSNGPYRQYEAIFSHAYQGNHYYRFRNTVSNKVFSVENGTTASGTNVHLFMASASNKASQFRLEKQQNGACQLIPRHSVDVGLSRCVGSRHINLAGRFGNTNVQLDQCGSGPESEWFVKSEGALIQRQDF